MKLLLNFLKNKVAANAIEYALIASLIAIAIIGAVTAVGDKTRDKICDAGKFPDGGGGGAGTGAGC